ncbi:MAG: tetratricopeptide repeat protein, partial [Planctomycetes bacterium]|nr:tetratricopeptide repeat protein [Planctomycetota bacterium]
LRATELAPDDAAAWLARGRIEHALGRLGEAADSLLEAHDLGAGAEARCALALVRLDAGAVEEAARELRRALDEGAGARARVALGMALEADLDVDGALAEYEAAAAAGEAPDAGLALARAALLQLHRADEARCLHEAETRLLDERRGPPRLDELMLAAARLQVRRVERARAALTAAQRLAPAEPLVLLARARLALADDDVDAAIAALREAEALAPAPPPSRDAAMPLVPSRPRPVMASWPVLDPPAALEYERRCLLGEALLRKDEDLRAAGREFELAARADPTGGWAVGGVAEIDRRVNLSPGIADRLRFRARPAVGAREAGWAALRAGREPPREWTRSGLERASLSWAYVTARAPRDASAWTQRALLAREARRWDEAVMLLERARAVDRQVEARLLEAQLFGVDLPVERDAATGRPVHVRDQGRAEDALLDVRGEGALVRARVQLAAPADRPGRREGLRASAEELVAKIHRALAAASASSSSPEQAHRARLEARAAGLVLADVRRALGEAEGCQLLRSVEAQAAAAAARHLAAAREAPAERLTDALAELDAAAELAPDHAEVRWERGRTLLRRGDWLAGVLELGRAVQRDPTLCAQAFRPPMVRIDLDRVLAVLDDRLAFAPEDAAALLLRGWLRCTRASFRRAAPGEAAAGIDDATAALRLDPGFHGARLLRALLRLETSDLDEALDDARAVAEAAPTVAPARFVEGAVWARRADVRGLEAAEVARRLALAREALDAARALGLDEAWIKNDKAFDPLRRAGTLGP